MGIDTNLTHVLGLSSSILASGPVAYAERVEDDKRENDAHTAMDKFAGYMTASLYDVFHVSGAVNLHLGAGDVPGGEYYGGLVYNPGPARHIVKVIGFLRMSGSDGAGVTRVDVRKHTALPTGDKSLFSNNVFKLILSSSAGAGVARETSTFAAASQSWAAGEFLGCVVEAAAAGTPPASDMVVMVFWKPSASYNS